MVDILYLLNILIFTVLSILIVLILIYCIPILFLQRFRHRRYIFMINVSISIFCCSVYWLVAFVMLTTNFFQFYNRTTCSLVFYVQMMCTLQVPSALVIVSIHRFYCVVYNDKRFFESKRWIWICITCQWLVGLILPLPVFIRDSTVRFRSDTSV